MRQLIQRVMQQADDLVVVFDYTDARGVVSRRVVSPIRFQLGERFLGLCLTAEEPRQFVIERCKNLKVDLACNYVMPLELCC